MTTRTLRHWFLIADSAWIVVAVAVSFGIRFGFHWTQGDLHLLLTSYAPVGALALATWAALSLVTTLDGFRGGWHLPNVLSRVLIGVALLTVVTATGGYFLKEYVSRLVLGAFAVLLFLGFVAIRCAARTLLASRYVAAAVRRVVIVGPVRPARDLADRIARHPELLWRVVGHLYPAASGDVLPLPRRSAPLVSVRTFGVVDVLKANQVDELVVCLPHNAAAESMKLVTTCRKEGIAVTMAPIADEPQAFRPRLRDLEGIPLISVEQRSIPALYLLTKRMMDLVLGAILLSLAAPCIVVIAAFLRWRKRQAFRSELRCGEHGELFRMYRLNVDRSRNDLPASEALLVRLSITELPQLWNVLRGEMSLVGPRPESPDRVKHYSDWQRQRLSIRPGVTGLAQVRGLRDSNTSEEKTWHDINYIQTWSPMADLALILQTIWTLVKRMVAERPEPRAAVAPPSVPPEIFHADRAQSGSD